MQVQVDAARPSQAGVLHGRRVIDEIKAGGIEFIPCLPDIHTSEGLLRPLTREPGLRLIRLCKEDEGVGICAALSYCNKRALLLMQYTGLLDSINAIRAVGVEYSLPICMMAGLLNKEPGIAPQASRHYGLRIPGPILDAMGVPHHLIETDADVPLIRSAIEDAYARRHPVVLFIGGRPLP